MKRNFLVPVFSVGFLTLLSGAQVDVLPGVARVSLILGDVSVQRGDTGDWSAAALNQPLVGGDRISTGDNSKAELQLDHANILRLSNNSHAKIATVQRGQNQRAQIQVQIGQGIAYYTVFKDSEAEVEIDTPNAAIWPISKDGVYRIEVAGFETQVIVRAGTVDIATPQGSARVDMGQSAIVRGTTHDAGNVLGGAPATDSWDSWNNDRDGVIRNAQSWNYTNRFYVGSEDLDAYGHWVNVPDYGRVWSPTVSSGWSPYRAGRWVWEPHWGWTWVSQEPWGWTPYHYGRWFLSGKSWMWWPGPIEHVGEGTYRPEWSPAYVSFFGFGGHRGVSAGFKSVGWLPLGPGDSFYPWYGRNSSQVNVVTVTEATSITRLIPVVAPLRDDNEFSNVSLAAGDGRIREAISSLALDRFGSGRSAPKTVSRRAFRDARIITGNLPIVPTREMLTATNRPASASSLLSGGRQERYFTKRQPSAAPQPFERAAAQLQESIMGTGQLVPAREVTQLDSADAAQTTLNNGIERRVEPTRDAPIEHTSRSRPEAGLRAAPSPRMSRSNRRMTPPAPAYRSARTHTASRPDESNPVQLRVPAASSTRRMTPLAAGSRGASAHAAQSYIDSANRQMDKGNYTAAIASYKRALQADGNSSSAKARLARARRAMQAENEILAGRR